MSCPAIVDSTPLDLANPSVNPASRPNIRSIGHSTRFTPEIAADMAKRSTAARLKAKEIREIAAAQSLADPATNGDPFVSYLAKAQAETLQRLISSRSPRDKMCLAKALRDLRETYHLVTGIPKPGLIKSGQARPMPRQLVAPIPTVTPVTPVTAQSGEAMPTMPAATPAESS
jgi:hypothetical protein